MKEMSISGIEDHYNTLAEKMAVCTKKANVCIYMYPYLVSNVAGGSIEKPRINAGGE